MSEREPPSPLDDLDARLEAAKAGSEYKASQRTDGMGAGLQVATELVVAVVVGVAIGWFLDEWLETRPLFLVIFFFFGAAAGALNVYRKARPVVVGNNKHPVHSPDEDT